MASNLDLNQELIEEAKKIGGFKTKKDAVNHALDEYVRRNKQLGILKYFGKVDYDPEYNYKAERDRG